MRKGLKEKRITGKTLAFRLFQKKILKFNYGISSYLFVNVPFFLFLYNYFDYYIRSNL